MKKLLKKRNDNGFTLIETLTVILILGILAALIAPLTLRWINRAKETEALNYLAAINKAQQVHYTSKNTFGESFSEVGTSVNGTPYYSYEIALRESEVVITHAIPQESMLRPLASVVWVDDGTIRTKICKGLLDVPVCLPD